MSSIMEMAVGSPKSSASTSAEKRDVTWGGVRAQRFRQHAADWRGTTAVQHFTAYGYQRRSGGGLWSASHVTWPAGVCSKKPSGAASTCAAPIST